MVPLDLKYMYFSIFLQTIDGVGVGEVDLITLVVGLGSCRVDQPYSLPLSSWPGWVLQHCPTSFSYVALSNVLDQVSCFHVCMVSLPTPTSSGTILLWCPCERYRATLLDAAVGEWQGQFCYAVMTSGQALATSTSSNGWEVFSLPTLPDGIWGVGPDLPSSGWKDN